MSNSKVAAPVEKPHPDFPLYPHKVGQWAKRINGRLKYFGSVKKDPDGKLALAKYHDQLAGRPAIAEGLTIADLCNRFLSVKEDLVESRERVRRTFKAYKGVTDELVEFFGKHKVVETITVEDFEQLRKRVAKRVGPVSVGNFVQVARMVFKYAHEATLIKHPVNFGPSFKRPSRKVMRLVKAAKGICMFEAKEIQQMLPAADPQMKAMILLGANCGFGNADCGQLPISAVNLETGWIHFPRPKTGIDRRVPLWPETIEALKVVIDSKRPAKDPAHDGLVFITKYGQPWFRDSTDNPVCQQFKKLIVDLKLYRRGLGFYSLRRGFETIAGDSGDQVATDYIMGHTEDADDMAAVYRQLVKSERLQKVVDHVHAWLFPPKPKRGKRQ